MVILVLVSAIIMIRQYVFFHNKKSIIKITATMNALKTCEIEVKDGTTHKARIDNAGWFLNYFATILFCANSCKYKTIIAKDTLSQEQFYTLRLYLRSINTLR